MKHETSSDGGRSTPLEVIGTALRVLRLANGEKRAVILVGGLGLASAIFEAVGLSFMIPLAQIAMGEGVGLDIPVIGPLLGWVESHFDLSGVMVVLLVVGFFLLGILVAYTNLVVSNALAMRFAHGLRQKVFETALDRPLSEVDALPSGQFINNLASETWKVCDALFIVVGGTVQAITLLVFLALVVLIAPSYTLILVVMSGIMALLLLAVARRVRGLGIRAVGANERFMAYVWDAIGGLRVIRGFGREDFERSRFEERSGQVQQVFTRLRILSGLIGPITQVTTIVMIATIVGFAMLRGDSIATLVGFLAIAFRMQPRVTAVLTAWTSLNGLLGSVDAIETALAPAPRHGANPRQPLEGIRDSVTFDNVTAGYPNSERSVLSRISCTFRAGEVTAVAGYSGAGKSTLAALLLRFIEPTEGRILVDGRALSAIEPTSWSRRIAFVEQNTFLFNGTIRENIGYGDLAAGPEEIRRAARIAQADAFIEHLPLGYDTRVGDNGLRLSQGQRQRIALARSIVRKPDLLILDEATNALDRPTERALRDAMSGTAQTCLVIVIAHRRETIETADRVVVLDHGRVIEEGTPAELAGRAGVYAELYLDLGEAPSQAQGT